MNPLPLEFLLSFLPFLNRDPLFSLLVKDTIQRGHTDRPLVLNPWTWNFFLFLEHTSFLQTSWGKDPTLLFALTIPSVPPSVWFLYLLDSLILECVRLGGEWRTGGGGRGAPTTFPLPSACEKPMLKQSEVWGMRRYKSGTLEGQKQPWVNPFSFFDSSNFSRCKVDIAALPLKQANCLELPLESCLGALLMLITLTPCAGVSVSDLCVCPLADPGERKQIAQRYVSAWPCYAALRHLRFWVETKSVN